METLPVIFRIGRSKADAEHGVTAVFPSFKEFDGMVTCYEHMGQHSACSRGWYATTRPATPEEYKDLLKERHKFMTTWNLKP